MDPKHAKELVDKTKNDFDKIADEFSKSRKDLWPELKKLKRYVKGDEKILDLGCGNGRLFEIFSTQDRSVLGEKKVDYTGIDISSKLIAKANKEYGDYFKVGDMLSLPFSDNYFDSIWSIAAFHHIPSKELRLKALKEMHRTLKKNGLVIMTCWNLYQFRYLKLILKFTFSKFFKKSKLDFKDIFVPWGKMGTNRYYHAFTKNELKNLFRNNGFKIQELRFLRRNDKKTNILIVAKKIDL